MWLEACGWGALGARAQGQVIQHCQAIHKLVLLVHLMLRACLRVRRLVCCRISFRVPEMVETTGTVWNGRAEAIERNLCTHGPRKYDRS